MHRALSVHEIISNILQNALPHDQAMAARTSSLWSDIALDWLWRELDSLLPLLRLLAPVVETITGLAFGERIEPRKWERFRYYSQRVRCLHYDDNDPDSVTEFDSSNLVSDTSLILLTLKPAGFGALLPNVQEIQWAASRDIVTLQHALPFLHGSLKTLTLTLGEVTVSDEDDDIVRFDDDIVRFDDDIVRFDDDIVRFDDDIGRFDDDIVRFLDTIWAKQDLSLETFGFHILGPPTEILQSLAAFLQSQPKMKVLQMPITIFGPDSDVAQDLVCRSYPEGLKSLMSTVSFRSPAEYLTRLQTIIQRAPQLRTLDLYLRGVLNWPSALDNLAPFLALANLEELNLVTSHGLHLDPEDIAMLGKSFPKMVRLGLQPQPQRNPHLGIQATSLIDFTKAFPKLSGLNMFIEPIRDPLQLPWRAREQHSQAQAQSLPSFNPLIFESLHVGSSPLEEKHIPDMAELLCILCRNPSFQIRCEEKDTEMEGPALAWRKVEALVRLVQGKKQDTAEPYHEWCRALILDTVARDGWPESKWCLVYMPSTDLHPKPNLPLRLS
ncbi:hypothetical protein FRC00_013566 [Tulasnella sp. 408]|nr:hypothetical protein FRC00_013566 [Tulasnella sp. 408]